MKNLIRADEKAKFEQYGYNPSVWPTVNPETSVTADELVRIVRTMPLSTGEYSTFLAVLGFAMKYKETSK